MNYRYKLDCVGQAVAGDTNKRADQIIVALCLDNGVAIIEAQPNKQEDCWYFTTDKQLDKKPAYVEMMKEWGL